MGVSMEEFGPISLDWFNGRQVEAVTKGEHGAVWSIKFVGGGAIHNFDPKMPEPKAIVGAGQSMVIMGLHKSENDRTPITKIRFGLETVQLNPIEFAMEDANLTKGQLVYAQRSRANMPMEPKEEDGSEDE